MAIPKKISETLRESIEEAIAIGKLAPGHHLDETMLAQEFGVSRTPIREALIAKGLVGFGPMDGTMSFVLLIAECINMVRKRLPLVC